MEGAHICDLKIPLLGINSRENSHIYAQGDMYKNINHLEMVSKVEIISMSINRRINFLMLYIHIIMEYYITVKTKELVLHVLTWIYPSNHAIKTKQGAEDHIQYHSYKV